MRKLFARKVPLVLVDVRSHFIFKKVVVMKNKVTSLIRIIFKEEVIDQMKSNQNQIKSNEQFKQLIIAGYSIYLFEVLETIYKQSNTTEVVADVKRLKIQIIILKICKKLRYTLINEFRN